MKYKVSNISQYKKIINTILEKQNNKPIIICLEGDLGAGKTTFTQVLGKVLDSKMIVKSPTFTIHNEYDLKDSESKLHHIDLYRLNTNKELDELNIKNLCVSGNIIIIEWADKFKNELESLSKLAQIFWLNLYYVDENTRLVTMKS